MREFVISANVRNYDIINHFAENKSVLWKQPRKCNAGDIPISYRTRTMTLSGNQSGSVQIQSADAGSITLPAFFICRPAGDHIKFRIWYTAIVIKERKCIRMYGAIVGDIIGSPFEFDRGQKSKDFELFSKGAKYTDDTVMTIAVAEALMNAGKDATLEVIMQNVVRAMQCWGRKYPRAGYGGNFRC